MFDHLNKNVNCEKIIFYLFFTHRGMKVGKVNTEILQFGARGIP